MLELVPLYTAKYELGETHLIGPNKPQGRTVGEVRSAVFTGERLNATLAGVAAADWMLRTGDVGDIDVRLTMRTDDGALIYVTYGGRISFDDPAGMFAMVAPRFETGDERYVWLNRIQAVGMGQLLIDASGARLEYEVYEVQRVASSS